MTLISGGVGRKIKINEPSFDIVSKILHKRSMITTDVFMNEGDKDCLFVSIAIAIHHHQKGLNGLKAVYQAPPHNFRSTFMGEKKKGRRSTSASRIGRYRWGISFTSERLKILSGINLSDFSEHELPGIPEIFKIQSILKSFKVFVDDEENEITNELTAKEINYKLLIYNAKGNLLFSGENFENDLETVNIDLFFDNRHFHYIISKTGVFSKSYFCEICHHSYDHRFSHRNCAVKCPQCFKYDRCTKIPNQFQNCKTCNREFNSNSCYNRHLIETCDKIQICKNCGLFIQKNHQCHIIYCSKCNQRKEIEHICMIPAYLPPKLKPKKHQYIFFDIETMNEKKNNEEIYTQQPNLCISQICCEFCESILEDNYNDCRDCGQREKIFFKGSDCKDVIEFFLRYVFEKALTSRITVIAHNGSKFDMQFIMNCIYNKTRGTRPQIILQGTQILLLKIGNIRFIDSFNFIRSSLKNMSKSIAGIKETKGFFCHTFNTKENQNYIGKFPEKSYYEYNYMTSIERSEFLLWYSENEDKLFNLKEELIKYCQIDVSILRKSCLIFSREMYELTNLKIFEVSITISSFTNKVYRMSHYQGNICVTPKNSFRLNDKQSKIALLYLLSEEKRLNIKIQSAYRGKEKVILCNKRRYKIDGWAMVGDEEHVFEYNGCFFHACSACQNSTTDDISVPIDINKTLRREFTARKLKDLEDAGYIVHVMTDCQFKKICENDKNILKSLNSVEMMPLNLNHAFYGGNVDTTVTSYECNERESIQYIDYVSLYPSVLRNEQFPVGGYESIIVGDEDCAKVDRKTFFGVIKCSVLPNNKLFHPILPMKLNDKLIFALCNVCAINESKDNCNHDEKDRIITGTWCSPEVAYAEEHGYKIIKIQEMIKFKSDGNLFKDFIDKFYVLKLYASGIPEGYTHENLDEFIDKYKKEEGIQLDKSKFERNTTKRTICKEILCSLFGKFVEKVRPQTVLVEAPTELIKLCTNSVNKLKSLYIVNENSLLVNYKNTDANSLPTVNVLIGAFTTSYGRIKLHQVLHKLGSRALYYDTGKYL